MMDNKLIQLLKNIAILLEIKGENPFKSRAYSNAARILEEEDIDIYEAVENGTLGNVKGIGDALQKKITEYVKYGHINYYDKLIEEIPESLVDITKINTIGPKKAKLLYEKLNIKNLDDLEKACENDEVRKLKGFSAKSQEIILNSIHHKKAAKGKFLYDMIQKSALWVRDILLSSGLVEKIEFSGEMRRFAETPNLIEFVIIANDKAKFIDFLDNVFSIEVNRDIIEFIIEDNVPVRIYMSEKKNFGTILHRTTGNDKYLQGISSFAIKLNKSIDKEYLNEQTLFDDLNLQFIPPELRETGDIVETAARKSIPRLIETKDLRGMIHVHTTWSDGKNTIEEMALAAKELGYEYIVITDHSQSAYYANGLSIDEVKKQHEEIDILNEKGLGIKILKGIESDILNDGSLDYPDSVMETFDLVIASVHSNFNMKKGDMTKRIIYALMSPFTNILGHPTGRLLLARESYEIDIRAVIDAASEFNKVIEINCNPYRLDLSWENVIYAKSRKLKLAINPDSHQKGTMSDVEIGIKVARKGGLEKSDVINTLDYNNFLRFLNIK